MNRPPRSDAWERARDDVSARRESWIEAEEHYRSLFAAMAEGVVVHAGNGQVIEANPAAERILGLSRDQILGKTSLHPQWPAIREDGTPFPGEDHPASITLRTGMPLRNQLMGVRAADAELRWISINSQPVFGDDKSVPNAAIVTFVDVTQRQAAAETIAKALAEKEALLREIHHRVKNNMQVISSLLQLQSNHLHDANLTAIFLECQNRIRAMALVHEQLYRSTSLAAIDFAVYLRDLSRLIARSQETAHTRVNIVSEFDSLHLGLEMAVPLGLIANGLMTNALKHAFPGRSHGNLWLRLKMRGAQTLEFSVADDGVGLPVNFDMSETRSVGLRVVNNLARQIRATLSFPELKDGGCCVQISSSLRV